MEEFDDQDLPSFDQTEELPSFESTEELPAFEATESVDTIGTIPESEGLVDPMHNKPGAADDIFAAITQTAFSLPGAKQTSAAINAVFDDSNLSFANKYRLHLDMHKAQQAGIKRNFPIASGLGEAGALIGGGAQLAKGLEKIPKIGLLFTPGKGVTLAPRSVGYTQAMGRNLVADTALISSRDIMDAELSELKDMGEITGQVFTDEMLYNSIGLGVGLTLNMAGRSIGTSASMIYNSEAAQAARQYIQGKTAKAARTLRELFDEVGESYVETSLKRAGIQRDNFTPESFKKAIGDRKDAIGKEIEATYEELDTALGGQTFPVDDLYSKMQATVRDYYNKGDSKAGDAVAKRIIENLKNEFITRGKVSPILDANGNPIQHAGQAIEKSVSQLWGFRKAFNDTAAGARMLGGNVPEDLVSMLGGDITHYLRSAPNKVVNKMTRELGEEAVAPVKASVATLGKKLAESNKEYSTLLKFSDTVIDGMKIPDTETVKAAFVRNMLSATPMGVGGFAAAAYNPAFGAAAMVSIAGMRTIKQKSDRLIQQFGDGPDSILGRTSKVADTIYKNYSDPYVSSLVPAFSRALSSPEVTDEEFADLIHDYNSRFNLYANPIGRDDESVKSSFDDIMNISGRVAPEIAAELAKAREMGDDMGPIMDQLSKHPELARFFKPGLGWNGKVYSDEDKAALAQQLQASYVNSPLSSTARRQIEAEIMLNGLIPDFENLPVNPPNVYKPKDK